MKKIFQTSALIVALISTVVTLNSCGSSEDEGPANVITDNTGIKVDLDWSTGGTVNDALQQADLDLRIYKGGNKVLYSESGGSFERIEFDPDLYADGEYTVVIVLFEATQNVTYTATINGITVTKPYTFNSNFVSDDDGREVEALTITKAGSKYTIQPID